MTHFDLCDITHTQDPTMCADAQTVTLTSRINNTSLL